ncbi:MAG: phosphoribosylaminoimidazolesuccinocarboxamide synthase [Oscillospiraceae bacterium]|nr:phosphoribosylaminoimidazolesuccinocarboxamide synthase [Oscillospiraceae bacterium]
MKQIYDGKTKTIFDSGDGNYVLQFKDDACGKDGVFDPGENQVGLTIAGKGAAGLKLSAYLFEKINAAGHCTHYVSSDLSKAQMTVKPAAMFGKAGRGIEIVLRYKAAGSFVRRFGDYIADGAILETPIVEITIKDDERGDPPITKEIAVALGILTEEEYFTLVRLMMDISGVIRYECAGKGLELIDLKLEFGKDNKGAVMLIDEVSGDIMRVRDMAGKSVSPLELTKILAE